MKKAVLALVVLVILIVCAVPAQARYEGEGVPTWYRSFFAVIDQINYAGQSIYVCQPFLWGGCTMVWITVTDATRIIDSAPPIPLTFDALQVGQGVLIVLDDLDGATAKTIYLEHAGKRW